MMMLRGAIPSIHPIQQGWMLDTGTAGGRIVLRVGMRLYKGNVDGGNLASTTESGSIAF